jgi:hypothetical protein
MQTAYFEAVVNRRHRVLGRKLHDFCLYDALFLSLAGNPLWTGERDPDLADLQEAALICSSPPDRLLRAELSPRNLVERFSCAIWQIRCSNLCDLPQRFADELAAFVAYIDDFYSVPKLWEGDQKGRPLRAPWILALACYIEMHSNMQEREIMTAPLGAMLWKAQAIAERRGENVSEIMTQDEIEIGREQQEAMRQSGEEFPEDISE